MFKKSEQSYTFIYLEMGFLEQIQSVIFFVKLQGIECCT